MGSIDEFNRVVDFNQHARIKAEDRKARELLVLYERTRKELIARLVDATDASRLRMQTQLEDLDRVIRSMVEQLDRQSKVAFIDAFRTGSQAIGKEIGVFEATNVIRLVEVPTRVVELLHERSLEHLTSLTQTMRRQVISTIQQGVIEGLPMERIIKRVAAPEGSLFTMPYQSAMRTVRQAIGETYNIARTETIKASAETVDGLGKAWMSRLQDSTRICTELHGQKVKADEPFNWRGRWIGFQPWAVWQGAEPKYHICHSVVVPWAPHWPENPKLRPLSGRELEAAQKAR